MPIKIYYLLLNTNNAGQYQFYVICIGLDLSSASRRGGSGEWKSATATHTHTHTHSTDYYLYIARPVHTLTHSRCRLSRLAGSSLTSAS